MRSGAEECEFGPQRQVVKGQAESSLGQRRAITPVAVNRQR